jgi:ADP-ribose pyrophosphatase
MSSQPTRLSTTTVHAGRPLGVRVDRVQFPDSADPVERWVVEYDPACVLVPLDATGARVLLTRQHRYPVDAYLWELPGGMIDPGESPERCAARELHEETGHNVLGGLTHVLRFFPEPAFADHRIDVFTAMVSEEPESGLPHDADVQSTAWVPLSEALDWIVSGEIASSWSIIGLLSVARLQRQGMS